MQTHSQSTNRSAWSNTEKPLITELLLAINFFVFVFALAYAFRLSNGTSGSYSEQLRDIAFRYGLRPDQPSVMTLITSLFLHLDPAHLAWNLAFLYVCGRMVERVLGHGKYLLLYFGCGIAAELIHIAITHLFLPEHIHTPVPTLGASGAIAGILGYAMVRFSSARANIWKWQVRIPVILYPWLAVQFIGGINSLYNPPKVGGVAYWAHIGGFLFGMVMGRLLRRIERGERVMAVSESGSTSPAPRQADDPRFHREIADVAVQLGETERAAEHYKKAVEISLRKGLTPTAVEIYKAAVATVGELQLEAATRYKLGLVLEETHNYEMAAAALEGVMASFPETEEAEMSALKAAQIHLSRLKQPEKAISVLKEYLASHPASEWRPYAEQILLQARTAATGSNQ